MGLYRSAWNVLQIFNMFGQSMAVNGVLAPRLQNHKGCICIAFHDHPNANTITNTIYTYIYINTWYTYTQDTCILYLCFDKSLTSSWISREIYLHKGLNFQKKVRSRTGSRSGSENPGNMELGTHSIESNLMVDLFGSLCGQHDWLEKGPC